MFKRIVLWSVFITLLILAGLFWYIDRIPPTEKPVTADTVRVTHMVKDGTQRFVGEISLPHSCYRILSQEYVPTPNKTDEGVLEIKTADLKLELGICQFISTKYYFDILTDNDRRLTVTMTIDGKQVPLKIYDREWQSSRGTSVTPIK